MKLRVGVLTVSDGCAAGVREDRSGALLEAWVAEAGHGLAARSVVPDDALTITRTLLSWADSGDVDVILVHARAAEDAFVRDGYGVNRRAAKGRAPRATRRCLVGSSAPAARWWWPTSRGAPEG